MSYIYRDTGWSLWIFQGFLSESLKSKGGGLHNSFKEFQGCHFFERVRYLCSFFILLLFFYCPVFLKTRASNSFQLLIYICNKNITPLFHWPFHHQRYHINWSHFLIELVYLICGAAGEAAPSRKQPVYYDNGRAMRFVQWWWWWCRSTGGPATI